jgi:hypothetical protein
MGLAQRHHQLIGETSMSKLNATQQAVVNTYSAFLKAGTSYGEALRKAATELGETPCPTLLAALAAVHAKHYECSFTWNGKGGAVFHTGEESTRETRQHAATKSWQRNVMVWFTPEKPKAPKSNARISREARDAAKAYLAQFDSVAAAIAALKAVA